MLETIIVTIIVLITIILMLRHFIKRSRSEAGGCQFCAHSENCTNISKSKIDLRKGK